MNRAAARGLSFCLDQTTHRLDGSSWPLGSESSSSSDSNVAARWLSVVVIVLDNRNESFVYNYSINLFLCDKSVRSFVPSPFTIFKELTPFLASPVYTCSDPSMNNPIMGAALPAFELVKQTE